MISALAKTRPDGSTTVPRGVSRRPRLGHIAFLNCLPLFWGLSRLGSLGDFDFRKGSPEALTESLLAGDLDIGPVTLYEALKHPDELAILPDVAIGCDGPVMSCIIVSKVPLADLDGAPVALASTSRTSTRLAELILERRFAVRPDVFRAPPDLSVMLDRAAAAVLIGDPALQVVTQGGLPAGLEVHDLGQMWKEWTGLPFVFAVYAARRSFAEHAPELVRDAARDIVSARDLGLREIERVCHQATRWESYSFRNLHEYYTSALNYDLGERQIAAIGTFAGLLHDCGDLPAGIRFAIFDGPSVDLYPGACLATRP